MDSKTFVVQLDPLAKAKLDVIVETVKRNAPHAPILRPDVLNQALGVGLNELHYGVVTGDLDVRQLERVGAVTEVAS